MHYLVYLIFDCVFALKNKLLNNTLNYVNIVIQKPCVHLLLANISRKNEYDKGFS